MKDWWMKACPAMALCLLCFGVLRAWPQQTNTAEAAFQDDPAAHQLYQEMIQAMRKATTLSWTSENRTKFDERFLTNGTYRIWLKKPNYARVEVTRAGQKKPSGILVGDGDYFWLYWPEGKYRQGWEQSGKYAEDYEKYQKKFFMKVRTPVGRHSIWHEIAHLGLMMILEPSTFHGYTDSLQAYIDPIILDTSQEAWKAINQYLALPGLGADPMTYVIGRDGKIVDGWFGYDRDRTKAAVEKLGL